MKRIKIGVFGLGRGFSYFDNILLNDVDIVAVCDNRQNALDEASKKLGGNVTCYTDFDKFIEHGLDAVFLANFFHEHASYAIRCLNKGIHVLSECTSNGTMAEGVALVRAAEKSKAIYMLAENYPYMLFNQEMKKVYSGGTLGKVMFAEGEYNHPFGPQDTAFINACYPSLNHWRIYLPRTYYITHSLAPLMYITGSMPKRVTAFPVYAPKGDEYSLPSMVGDAAAIITTLNDDRSVYRITGCAAFGAHGNSYRICAANGQIENVRGTNGKIMLRYNSWQIPEGRQETNFYMPEWDESAEVIKQAGHDGGDYFVMKRFFECIRENKKPDFDIYFATTMASVAILAHRSLLEGGKPFDIPDFRLENDRIQYENDRLTPFPGFDGTPATLPCCSNTDYRASDVQVCKYNQLKEEYNKPSVTDSPAS